MVGHRGYIAGTFIEAWGCVEAMIGEGAATYTFQMEFQCSRSQQKQTALPYMQDGSFICIDCFSQNALQ